jgi:hypothetical protein
MKGRYFVMKKFFSFFLIVMILLSCSILSSAEGLVVGESREDGRYIFSNPVPQEVTKYAKSRFELENISWADAMGLVDKASELKLGSGFDITLYDTGMSTEVYYFPVLYQDKIERLYAVVVDDDGSYHIQSGYDYLARPLNQLELSAENPIRVIASQDAIYAVDSYNTVTILFEEVLGDPTQIKEQVQNLSQSRYKTLDGEVVEITDIAVDSMNLTEPLSQLEERATAKKLSVAKLKNRSVGGRGVCWAATTASCIDYYKDGKTNTSYAETLMDELIEDRKNNNNGSTAAGIPEVRDYIESYCPDLTTSSTTKLTYDKVKPYINSNQPLYTSWSRVSDDAGHAIVLCGYRMSGGTEQMYLMDSNYTDNYQICDFGENYQTPGSAAFKWFRTVTVS